MLCRDRSEFKSAAGAPPSLRARSQSRDPPASRTAGPLRLARTVATVLPAVVIQATTSHGRDDGGRCSASFLNNWWSRVLNSLCQLGLFYLHGDRDKAG